MHIKNIVSLSLYYLIHVKSHNISKIFLLWLNFQNNFPAYTNILNYNNDLLYKADLSTNSYIYILKVIEGIIKVICVFSLWISTKCKDLSFIEYLLSTLYTNIYIYIYVYYIYYGSLIFDLCTIFYHKLSSFYCLHWLCFHCTLH